MLTIMLLCEIFVLGRRRGFLNCTKKVIIAENEKKIIVEKLI